MSQFRLIILFWYLLFSSCTYALNYEYVGHCTSPEHSANFEDCLDDELADYDRKLNKIYKEYIKKYPYSKIRYTEIAWVNFKEKDCDFMAQEVNGGKYYQFIYNACSINKTRSRIHDLKRSLFYSGWFEKNS